MVRVSQFVGWALLFASYATFYVCRKNYAFWLRSMMAEYGMSTAHVGMLGSAFELSFGAGKLLGGVLVDSWDPVTVLCASLALSAGANVALASTSSLPLLCGINFVNGGFQSLGWPALAKVLLLLFPKPQERGRWYSLVSVSQNVGSALTPVVVAAGVAGWGWKGELLGPAAAAGAVAMLLYLGLTWSTGAASASATGDAPAQPTPSGKAAPAAATAAAPTVSFVDVFRTPALLMLGVAYLFISVIRVGLATWLPMYLKADRAMGAEAVSVAIVAMEAGGMAGGLASGSVSDALFAGRRAPVMALCSAALCVSLALFWADAPLEVWVPGFAPLCASLGVSPPVGALAAWSGLIGLFSFPVHVLLGLAARELVPAGISATAGGLVKAMGQVGSVLAGYALAQVVQQLGWRWVGFTFVGSAAASAAVLMPLWNATAVDDAQAGAGAAGVADKPKAKQA